MRLLQWSSRATPAAIIGYRARPFGTLSGDAFRQAVLFVGAPPKVQKTLLSFFKPSTAVVVNPPSDPTMTAVTSPSSSASPLAAVPSKRRLQADQYDSLDIKDRTGISAELQPRKRRVRNIRGEGAGASPTPVEDPIFPTGFSSDMHHFGDMPLVPPSSSSAPTDPPMLREDSNHEIESTVVSKLDRTIPTSRLSRFEYHTTNADTDHGNIGSGAPDSLKVEGERRERFLRKLGNIPQVEKTHESGSRESARSRRRLIISESYEEDNTRSVDEDAESSSRRGQRGDLGRLSAGCQPQQHPPPAKTDANPIRPPISKKAFKSVYTPLEKQFVEIKEQHPDAVLCIEVGYKFRFFGEDAEIASRELCIAHFMDHNFYTASIPIHRLDVHVRRLVHAGYKVGVVRQMETAALKSAGENKSAPFTRKLTHLYTKGTFLESLDQDEEQFQGSFVGRGPSSQYLMCIFEQPQGGSGSDEKVKIAILAVQPATGDIIYDEFTDGHFRNELETRLLHIQPAELIVPTEPLSKATEKLVGYLTASSQRRVGSVGRGQEDVRIERIDGFVQYDKAFARVSEFYSTSLKEEQLTLRNQGAASGSSKQSQMEALLKTVLGLSRNLVIALSAMITHLTDFGLAPVFRLSKYFECFTSRSHMLLNGNTIANLEIYRNQTDWTTRGSLFSILDHTYTGFGRRLLKKWVGKPLVDRMALQERVDAVEEILVLAGRNTYLESTKSMLKGIMDLEKGVCRIHYGKSSPKEFLAIVQTFMKVAGVIPTNQRSLSSSNFGLQSPMLRRLVGSLSDAAEDSRFFLNALNEHAAAKNDKLQMFQDEAIIDKWPEIQDHRDSIVKTEEELATHLGEVRKLLREPRIEYSSVSGIDYLVEVKNKDVAKVPKSWVKISGTKQASRFHTPETVLLVQAKAQHQERLALACDRAFASFQREFSERYEVFRDLVQNLAVLDCLFSLAVVACLPGYVKPEYVDDNICETQIDTPEERDAHFIGDDDRDLSNSDNADMASSSRPQRVNSRTTIDIKNGRHPMVEQMLPSGNFVPNDIQFGTDASTGINEKTLILTGPNMGGKSCYIRQVALLCVMAQIGSYLPADSARVSLLDAVFTRMGASDNIFGHESTFMVELQETSDILKMASPRSLVILDELGRGTSTLDGVAIAYAVLKHVVGHIGALTLFVTHYPSLADVSTEFPEGTIRNYHMGFMASGNGMSGSETATEADLVMGEPSILTKTALDDMDIVFLYKLVPGVSLKSYGLNVARMAKLPLPLILKAKIKSKELEVALERRVEMRQREPSSGRGQESRHQKLLSLLRDIFECATEETALESFKQLLDTGS